MIPSTRKEMEEFVWKYSDGQISVHWLEPGQAAYVTKADGKIFLEERELNWVSNDAEDKLVIFVNSLAADGFVDLTLRGQGLQKLGPTVQADGTFQPGYVMTYAAY